MDNIRFSSNLYLYYFILSTIIEDYSQIHWKYTARKILIFFLVYCIVSCKFYCRGVNFPELSPTLLNKFFPPKIMFLFKFYSHLYLTNNKPQNLRQGIVMKTSFKGIVMKPSFKTRVLRMGLGSFVDINIFVIK